MFDGWIGGTQTWTQHPSNVPDGNHIGGLSKGTQAWCFYKIKVPPSQRNQGFGRGWRPDAVPSESMLTVLSDARGSQRHRGVAPGPKSRHQKDHRFKWSLLVRNQPISVSRTISKWWYEHKNADGVRNPKHSMRLDDADVLLFIKHVCQICVVGFTHYNIVLPRASCYLTIETEQTITNEQHKFTSVGGGKTGRTLAITVARDPRHQEQRLHTNRDCPKMKSVSRFKTGKPERRWFAYKPLTINISNDLLPKYISKQSKITI